MIITLVVDTFNIGNNGTTVSATRFAHELKRRGHTVRVLTTGSPESGGVDPATGFDMYFVPEWKLPGVTWLAHRQGTLFGKPVRATVTRAVTGADVVHIYQPWALDGLARRVAKKLHIPAIAAFHIQPENITYNMGLGWFPPAAYLTYYLLYLFFYRHFRDIHCPSKFIAAQLRSHGYKAKLHILSNGVHPDFYGTPDFHGAADAPLSSPPREQTGDDAPFRILMSGRLAPEKRQDVLIRAVMKSKYRDRIQLYFAGSGHKEKSYKKMGRMLPRPPIFGYYSQPDLLRLIHSCDLYVHTSDIEIEGISCMESFCAGLVPVIANSKKSATAQFALSDECLFRAGSSAKLAERIDYWVEHPAERQAMSEMYAQYGKGLSLAESVRKMERVYHSVAAGGRNEYYHSRLFNVLTRFFYTCLVIPLLFLWLRLLNGVHIRGKRNLRGLGSALTLCNHVHLLDSVMVGMALYPRKLIFPTIPQNLNTLFPGLLVRLLGGVPVPRTPRGLDDFFDEMEVSLTNGRVVHFFPEGDLKPYNTNLCDFKKGAFYLAARARVPVVPMTISFCKPRGLYRLYKKKPAMRMRVGKPIYPVSADVREDERVRMRLARDQMLELRDNVG
ncbi:MAG: glycosyltransferase [Defluviitaleaceae bacterium]|nr:glycosyltransferase [Defluviitaleaceae bacterium]